MGTPRDAAPGSLLLLPLLSLALIVALVSFSSHNAFAQHKVDPETWVEMRKMFRGKGPDRKSVV